MNIHGIMLFKS